jgi:hypothetical protein
MRSRHAAVVSLILALAVASGAYAAQRTTAASDDSEPAKQSTALAKRARALDRMEASLRKALGQRPPALPKVPRFKPVKWAPVSGLVAATYAPAASAQSAAPAKAAKSARRAKAAKSGRKAAAAKSAPTAPTEPTEHGASTGNGSGSGTHEDDDHAEHAAEHATEVEEQAKDAAEEAKDAAEHAAEQAKEAAEHAAEAEHAGSGDD